MSEPTVHIYAPTRENDEKHRRSIRHSIDRGQTVRLHRHAYQPEHKAKDQVCSPDCQNFEPQEVE